MSENPRAKVKSTTNGGDEALTTQDVEEDKKPLEKARSDISEKKLKKKKKSGKSGYTTAEEEEKSTETGPSIVKSQSKVKIERLMLKESKRQKSLTKVMRDDVEVKEDASDGTDIAPTTPHESNLSESKSLTMAKRKLKRDSKARNKENPEEDKESSSGSVTGRDPQTKGGEKSGRNTPLGTSVRDLRRPSTEEDSERERGDISSRESQKRRLPKRDHSKAKIKGDSDKKNIGNEENDKYDSKDEKKKDNDEDKKDNTTNDDDDISDEDDDDKEKKEIDFRKITVKFPNGETSDTTWVSDRILKEVVGQLSAEKGIPENYIVLSMDGRFVDVDKTLGELGIHEVLLTDEPLLPNCAPIDPETKKKLKIVKRVKRQSQKKLNEEDEKASKRDKKGISSGIMTTRAKFSLEVMDSCPEGTRNRINYRESVLFNPSAAMSPANSDLLPEVIKQQMAAAERRKLYVVPPLDDPMLQRAMVDKIKSKVMGRLNVAFELLDKEQDYLRYLCMILLSFKRPMLENQTKLNLTEEEIHVAYGNIEDIIPLHQELLDILVSKFNLWTENQTIGDAFTMWLTAVVEPYKVYAINYHDCLTVWEDIKDKPGVKNFLELTYAKTTTSAGQLDIGAFLIKPIQRITRDYTMIFERLIKNTPDTHPDHKELNQVMESLKVITMEINGATHDPADLKYFAQTGQEEVYSPRSTGGYIYKKGANVRNWKYRFMKIELDTKELVYYKADNKKEKKGSIPLTSILDVKPATYKDKGGTERNNLFIIVTTDRTFFIQPHNQVQRLRWIEAIDFYRRESSEHTQLTERE